MKHVVFFLDTLYCVYQNIENTKFRLYLFFSYGLFFIKLYFLESSLKSLKLYVFHEIKKGRTGAIQKKCNAKMSIKFLMVNIINF